jgi:nitrile hydratase subunit beta
MPRATPTPAERARYPLGQRVRVVRRFPKRGHIRTPFYLRGKNGCIDSILGWFLNPETLADGQSGRPPLMLYRVKFAYRDIWESATASEDATVIMADLSEDWLEPEEAQHDSHA